MRKDKKSWAILTNLPLFILARWLGKRLKLRNIHHPNDKLCSLFHLPNMVTQKELDNVQYYVGKAMTMFPCFRIHKHRDDLVKWVRSQGVECSAESVSRCQRKLWGIAIDALEKGELEYAFNFIPSKKEDFEEWCRIRKVDAEIYRKHFSNNFSQQ